MPTFKKLFENNRAWAQNIAQERPNFFSRLQAQQNPRYMWIGCSDSRVPANQITGLEPGEVFVHRNIANVVSHSDLNCLSTIQYAVDQLKIKHLMVVGHYGCGGVKAALQDLRVGLADNWIRHVKDVRDRHQDILEKFESKHRLDVLCELNAIEQTVNVAQTTIVQDAWEAGQKLALHGWCYHVKNGLIVNLNQTITGPEDILPAYNKAIESVLNFKRED